MEPGQEYFSSPLVLLPFALRVYQSISRSACPSCLLLFSPNLRWSLADQILKWLLYCLEQSSMSTLKRKTALSPIPHFFPHSEKVSHSWLVGMSSKFSRTGNFEGPGGKGLERFVKIFFTNMIPKTAAAMSSKMRRGAMVIRWVWVRVPDYFSSSLLVI